MQGKVRPIRRVTEVQVEFVDEERGSVLAWPFADKGSSRIVLYKKPTPKTVEFENFVERCRKAGWERDVSFWDSTHLACEMKGRYVDRPNQACSCRSVSRSCKGQKAVRQRISSLMPLSSIVPGMATMRLCVWASARPST